MAHLLRKQDMRMTKKLSCLQENGHNTFHVYFLLMQSILISVNGQKNFIVQYNEESAW